MNSRNPDKVNPDSQIPVLQLSGRRHLLRGVISLILAAAAAIVISACSGAGSEVAEIGLIYANESLSTMQITAPGFANGAGPWTPPKGCTGVFVEMEADNNTSIPVALVIRVGATGTSGDGAFLRFTLGVGEKLHTTILCRFNEPYPASFKAWHDGVEGAASLTGVSLSAIPMYYLVYQ